ncbi:MAG TPA: YdeI/OmpD-associated family protein [Candidatus Didemnitutus sp.]|jgi:uncharacterized protein YdeI (YjbR/CyaY-like superfamily)
MRPRFFKSAAEFRQWLETNHATTVELFVGFYKKSSGRTGLTYFEAVDELLCFGWIDGVKRRVDDQAYSHRVTPRRAGSTWSNVNVGKVERLAKAGRMHASGLAAFAARSPARTGTYSYEQDRRPVRPDRFPLPLERELKKHSLAWAFWSAQPPGYRRTMVQWVVSAKLQAAQKRRFVRLVSESGRKHRLFD